MLRLLTGCSGSGKSAEILKEIGHHIANRKKVYLIVPEQQVYSCERNILTTLPTDAGLYLQILSFSRLSENIATRFGGIQHSAPSKSARSLLMWRNLRELSGILEEYGSKNSDISSDLSMTELMLATVDELKYNGIHPSKLEALADTLEHGSPLYKKLRDIALVSAAFDGLVGEIYGANPADRLTAAAKKLDKEDFFGGTQVYIDSFTSFTSQEFDMLERIIRQADDTTVSLTLDIINSQRIEFVSTADTANRLIRLACDANVNHTELHPDGSHVRTSSRELALIEDALWRLELGEKDRPSIPEEQRGSVRLLTAESVYDEAHAAALNILGLVNGGMSYGDIAVIVRNTSTWDGILDTALDTYSIPYFLSERTDLCSKPAARMLICALRAISRRWQAQDIMELCKTGMCGIPPQDIDMFEEYIETWQINGKRMTDSAWSMNPDGYSTEMSERAELILDAANRTRERIMSPLLSLEADLRFAENVTEQCRALYSYLTKMGIRENMIKRAEELLSFDNVKEAGEELRLWDFISEALVTLSSAMQDSEPLGTRELEVALSILFSSTDIGSVPARHDCVIIGSAATVRIDNVKAVIILGLCEGEFPTAESHSGLLSNSDREILRDNNISLDLGAEIEASEELLYVYRAMTMPSEKLIASHSLFTTDGKAKAPSVAFSRLRFILPYLKPYTFRSASVYSAEELTTDKLRPTLADGILPATARAMLGDRLYITQSKIERYFGCPYSYYGSYILKLRERCKAELDSLSSGLFLHHVLECFLRRTLDAKNRITPLSREEIFTLADEIIEKYVTSLFKEDISDKGRLLHIFCRMRTVAIALLESILEELYQSDFRPVGFEMKIGGDATDSPSPMELKLELEDSDPVTLLFSGVIDRVDIYRKDGEIYIRVIDYKSSAHELDERSIKEKLNIQLLLYLFTLCSKENRALFSRTDANDAGPRPAAAVYISPEENTKAGGVDVRRSGIILDDKDVLSASSHELDTRFLPGVKPNKDGQLTGKALCSPERIRELEELLYSSVRDTVKEMYDGNADRRPSTDSCRYCRIKESCFARA